MLLDSKKTLQTVNNLTLHYFNEGYFNIKVKSEQTILKNRKVAVNYFVDTGNPYLIDSISTNMESKVLPWMTFVWS